MRCEICDEQDVVRALCTRIRRCSSHVDVRIRDGSDRAGAANQRPTPRNPPSAIDILRITRWRCPMARPPLGLQRTFE